MQVIINGQSRQFEGVLNIQSLIEQLGIDSRVCAVARNSVVVKKEDWAHTMLEDNDRLECLQFMGGG
ncbi:sulfur carrier protein ThiS [Helicobacter baculiformis]|uniref:Sulfur carrier protein ThiS n=1 Tax=Helicobacter baculiformis TaxID=427351 RepID=A0ABV7ZIW8_9HELI|nr:sulfur carrier protein ThiS [Helicobacter baculiformis]